MATHPTAIPFQWSGDNLSPLIPPIKSWRPYRRDDRNALDKLRRPTTNELFGDFNMDEMLELSAHRLVMENKEGQLIACLCLRNYPNIPALLPEVWTDVIWRLYRLSELNHENTLFMHMLVWDRRYNWDLLCYMLKSMFLSLFRLQFVVLVVLPNCENAAMLSNHLMGKYFIRVRPAVTKGECVQTLYIAFRQKILPAISVRRAVAEDNDDLVGIINDTSPILKNTYGEFYISEIILDQPSSRQIIVAEMNNETVGMLCLNTGIWMDRLNYLFDIHTYHGFRKHNEDENKNSKRSSSNDQNEMNVEEDTTKPIRDRIQSEFNEEMSELDSNVAEIESTLQSTSESSTDNYLLLLNISLGKRLSSFESNEDDIEQYSNRIHFPDSFERPGYDASSTNTPVAILGPDFTGPQDAFLIELHGMRHDVDERLAITLLEAAFQTFPNLSYCILTVPSQRRYFPLLSYFVKVIARDGINTDERSVVYTIQRNVVFSAIVVRLATPDDRHGIKLFLSAIIRGSTHNEDMVIAIEMHNTHRIYPYVVLAEGTVIGVCILIEYNHLATLRHNYDVDQFLVTKHHTNVCQLKMMIMHPAFTMRLPFILSELFRQSGFTSMFYLLKESEPSNRGSLDVNSILPDMIPIRPRQRMHYRLDKLKDYQWPPSHVLHNSCKPFGLYYHSVNSCTKRKIAISERIVVVGCSTTALAFMEELIFNRQCQDVYYTHITMISPNGFAVSVFQDISVAAKTFMFKEFYTPDYIRRLAFRTWVNLVYGYVTRIDRKKKLVYVDDKSFLYDRLYLFCGLQFDYPIKLKTPAKQPKNVVFLNNLLDAELMLIKTRTLRSSHKQYHIVVYGENLFCYTCIEALLNAKVDPARITFIRPRSKESSVGTTTLFNDNFVDELMDQILEDSGIEVLDNYDIIDWKVEKGNTVTKIQVESDLNVLDLYCSMFVCFERKIVARRTILVLNSAGLVFDGRLVINEKFQTNDPAIYAAGPMTKYKRILYADNSRHEFFSSREIGARLARKTTEELNPLRSADQHINKYTFAHTVHQFKECKIRKHLVLGGFHFLWIRAPGRPIAYDLARNQDNYGVDLITGKHSNPNKVNYCRVHLNMHSRVQSIVCLTKMPLNLHKYISLHDRHESNLNNLRIRFESNLIPDLHEYFTNPWVYLLYHDRFITQLIPGMYEIMSKTYYPEPNIVEEIGNVVVRNKWANLNEKQRTIIVENYMTSVYETQVRDNLLDFIAKHIDELSMFYDTNRIIIPK